MIRLHILVEGATEQNFANKVLSDHLIAFDVIVDARRVLTGRDKGAGRQFRGGIANYQKVKNDITTWLKQDGNFDCRFSTMFDFYALPHDFPGYEEAGKNKDPYKKIEMLEDYFKEDICDDRFIPYIQLHEFESLILADPQQLDWEYLEHEDHIANLVAMVENKNPELINHSFDTAPSRRIAKEIDEYDKVRSGINVVEKIGVVKLKQKCKHFKKWVEILENL